MLEHLLSAGKADDDLPAIATRGAAAHAISLHNRDLKAALCQLYSRRQSSKASAHYHHIGLYLPIQRGLQRCPRHASFVITLALEQSVRLE